jgi:hypothetical protein
MYSVELSMIDSCRRIVDTSSRLHNGVTDLVSSLRAVRTLLVNQLHISYFIDEVGEENDKTRRLVRRPPLV